MESEAEVCGKALFESMKELEMIDWAKSLDWDELHPDTKSNFIEMAVDVLRTSAKMDGRIS